jgi:hypothetical protein
MERSEIRDILIRVQATPGFRSAQPGLRLYSSGSGSGRDIHLISGIAGSTQPSPAIT